MSSDRILAHFQDNIARFQASLGGGPILSNPVDPQAPPVETIIGDNTQRDFETRLYSFAMGITRLSKGEYSRYFIQFGDQIGDQPQDFLYS